MSKISIITICRDAGIDLQQTIDSVLFQTYRDIEYIFVDGLSSDIKTVEIIENYRNNFSHFVSESDNGIYDAMNKGIKLATGDFVLFLNAGDRLTDSICIEALIKAISIKSAQLYFTDVVWVDLNNKVIRSGLPEINYASDLYFNNFPHSGTIYNRNCFLEFGLFREDLKILADYELNLRLLVKHKVSYKTLDTLLSFFYTGGISTSEKGQLLREKEMKEIKSTYFKIAPKRNSNESRGIFKKLKGNKEEKLNRIFN